MLFVVVVGPLDRAASDLIGPNRFGKSNAFVSRECEYVCKGKLSQWFVWILCREASQSFSFPSAVAPQPVKKISREMNEPPGKIIMYALIQVCRQTSMSSTPPRRGCLSYRGRMPLHIFLCLLILFVSSASRYSVTTNLPHKFVDQAPDPITTSWPANRPFLCRIVYFLDYVERVPTCVLG